MDSRAGPGVGSRRGTRGAVAAPGLASWEAAKAARTDAAARGPAKWKKEAGVWTRCPVAPGTREPSLGQRDLDAGYLNDSDSEAPEAGLRAGWRQETRRSGHSAPQTRWPAVHFSDASAFVEVEEAYAPPSASGAPRLVQIVKEAPASAVPKIPKEQEKRAVSKKGKKEEPKKKQKKQEKRKPEKKAEKRLSKEGPWLVPQRDLVSHRPARWEPERGTPLVLARSPSEDARARTRLQQRRDFARRHAACNDLLGLPSGRRDPSR